MVIDRTVSLGVHESKIVLFVTKCLGLNLGDLVPHQLGISHPYQTPYNFLFEFSLYQTVNAPESVFVTGRTVTAQLESVMRELGYNYYDISSSNLQSNVIGCTVMIDVAFNSLLDILRVFATYANKYGNANYPIATNAELLKLISIDGLMELPCE